MHYFTLSDSVAKLPPNAVTWNKQQAQCVCERNLNES